MSDIVERLRAWHTLGETITGDVQLYLDAADRIETLEAALRNLLQEPPSILDDPDTDAQIVIRMRKIARAALDKDEGK